MNIVLRRLVLPVALFLVWAPAAQAWSWPVQGPVLQPFVYDEAHPYDAGQHRGIDIGADGEGESVFAPTAGTVSFAGTVPTSGTCVTIQTPDGYSVTLTHLGSLLVARGAAVDEGDAVGTIGPSGTPEFARPYVHLGIRTTSDPNGYLDPLGFLPFVSAGDPTSTEAAPAPAPAAAAASRPSTTHGSATRTSRAHSRSDRGRRASQSRASQPAAGESSTAAPAVPRVSREQWSSGRSASQVSTPRSGAGHRTPMPYRRFGEPANSRRRPVVEAANPSGHTGLDAGHETRPGTQVSAVGRAQPLLPLVLNATAAAAALAAALAAARRRRRTASGPHAGARIQHLARAPVERTRLHQAA